MTTPGARGHGQAGWRLAGIGLLALGVAAALYVAGRLHQPDYTFSMFGADPFPPKSVLATIALALAGSRCCSPCGSTANCSWRATRRGRCRSHTG